MIDNTLISYMEEMLRNTPTAFKRYAYSEIDWNQRMIGIVGARGIGKSTMVKQYIIENRDQFNVLYTSADHTYFSNHSISDLADNLVKSGYNALVIDEVHKYENWSRELKQIYDIHSELKVILTGSSILDIQKGEVDLSRRIVIYEMYGLSFREYLKMFHNINAETYSLEDILNHKVSLKELAHPLPYFKQYLKEGYYPFAIEGSFSIKMQQVITQTIESDIAQFADLKATTARKLKKLLSVISTLAPYKPNVSTLSTVVGVSKNNINDYLIYMEKAGLLGQLRDDTGGIRGIGKVEKVFIDNPSLMHVLANGVPNEGNCRETFFYNQVSRAAEVYYPKNGDFQINENIIIEVGGAEHDGYCLFHLVAVGVDELTGDVVEGQRIHQPGIGGEGKDSLGKQTRGLQEVVRAHRHEHVKLEVALRSRHTNGNIVAHCIFYRIFPHFAILF